MLHKGVCICTLIYSSELCQREAFSLLYPEEVTVSVVSKQEAQHPRSPYSPLKLELIPLYAAAPPPPTPELSLRAVGISESPLGCEMGLMLRYQGWASLRSGWISKQQLMGSLSGLFLSNANIMHSPAGDHS